MNTLTKKKNSHTSVDFMKRSSAFLSHLVLCLILSFSLFLENFGGARADVHAASASSSFPSCHRFVHEAHNDTTTENHDVNYWLSDQTRSTRLSITMNRAQKNVDVYVNMLLSVETLRSPLHNGSMSQFDHELYPLVVLFKAGRRNATVVKAPTSMALPSVYFNRPSNQTNGSRVMLTLTTKQSEISELRLNERNTLFLMHFKALSGSRAFRVDKMQMVYVIVDQHDASINLNDNVVTSQSEEWKELMVDDFKNSSSIQRNDTVIVVLGSNFHRSLCRSPTNYFGYLTRYVVIYNAAIGAARGIAALLSIICLSLLFILRNHPLIKARFVSPFVGGLALLVHNGGEMIYVFVVLRKVLNYSLFKDEKPVILFHIIQVTDAVSLFVAASFYIINGIRYFYTRNLYRIMSHGTTSNENVESKISWNRKITSKWFYLLVTTLLTVLCMVIVGIGYPLAATKNRTYANRFTNIFILISCVSVGVFGLLSLFGDMLAHRKGVWKHGIKWYLTFSDPYLFRIENMLIVPGILAGVLMFCLVSFLQSPIYFPYTIRDSVLIGLSIVLFHTITNGFLAGGLITIAQLFRLRPNTTDTTDIDESKLEDILRCPEYYDLMNNYCRREFSLENLKLWDLLESYQASSISVGQYEKLISDFVANNSPYQVNLSNKVKQSTEALLNKKKNDQETTVPLAEVRSILYPAVIGNLADTYIRLKRTDEFIAMKSKLSAAQELLHKEFAPQ